GGQSGFEVLRLADRECGCVHKRALFLGALAFGDVDVHPLKADQSALSGTQSARLLGNPHDAPVLAPDRRLKAGNKSLFVDQIDELFTTLWIDITISIQV